MHRNSLFSFIVGIVILSFIFGNGMFYFSPIIIIIVVFWLVNKLNKTHRRSDDNYKRRTLENNPFDNEEKYKDFGNIYSTKEKERSLKCDYCGHMNKSDVERCENCKALIQLQ
ncbi:MAG: hypothetical protein K9L74_04340 [Candidatus Izimaplasma sp.]|nr:hypothetical protein [Candidatus Izimaplasma bacterium]